MGPGAPGIRFTQRAQRTAEGQRTAFWVELLAPAHRASPPTTSKSSIVRGRDLSAHTERSGRFRKIRAVIRAPSLKRPRKAGVVQIPRLAALARDDTPFRARAPVHCTNRSPSG